MKIRGINSIVGLFSALALITLSQWCTAAEADGYRLQAGDVIAVSVWKELDLQKELLINPDGRVSFPLIGFVMAKGKTLSDLHEEIVKKLSEFIPEPSVSISLLKTFGNLFYVIGKVNRPGQYPMSQPTSVLQALSVAGGMTTYASENSIKVIRSHDNQAFEFRYGDIEDGENLEQNIMLKSGDVVLVP